MISFLLLVLFSVVILLIMLSMRKTIFFLIVSPFGSEDVQSVLNDPNDFISPIYCIVEGKCIVYVALFIVVKHRLMGTTPIVRMVPL